MFDFGGDTRDSIASAVVALSDIRDVLLLPRDSDERARIHSIFNELVS
jgi:hypothetical protein